MSTYKQPCGRYGPFLICDLMNILQVDYQSTAHSNLVLTAAKLIAPRLEPGDVEAGFQWCLDELFKAKLDRLAHDVMMAKATYFLTTAEVDKAAQVLKQFEKHGGSMRFKAATNLSFLYLLEGNITEAQRYAHLALSHDEFHVQVRQRVLKVALYFPDYV